MVNSQRWRNWGRGIIYGDDRVGIARIQNVTVRVRLISVSIASRSNVAENSFYEYEKQELRW